MTDMAQDKSYERGQVIQIINSVIDKMEQNTAPTHEIVSHIAELAQTLDKLKKEIAETDAGAAKEEQIRSATDELDAIVSSTAEATNDILAACEQIEKYAEENDIPQIAEYVSNIYVACGFQDITGQRITKVVGAMRVIENKVDRLLKMLDDHVGPIPGAPAQVADLPADTSASNSNEPVSIETVDEKKDLLNGPQLPEKAVTQDDIDKLLAEFD